MKSEIGETATSSADVKLKRRSRLFGWGLRGMIVALLPVIFSAAWMYYEHRAEEDGTVHPDSFPIVAVTEVSAERIFYNEIADFRKRHPDVTFLIPRARLAAINDEFAKKAAANHQKRLPVVHAEELADGRQLVEFDIHGDFLYRSRYEATATEVKPLTMLMSGPGFVFLPCEATMIAGFVLLVGLEIVIALMRKRTNSIIENDDVG